MRYKCELVSFDLAEWSSENVRSTAPKNANRNRILRNFDVSFTAKHLLVETFDWQILEENELDCLHNCRLSERLFLHCQNCNIWAMLLPDTRFAERESNNHFDAVSSWFHFLILFCCMQSTICTWHERWKKESKIILRISYE